MTATTTRIRPSDLGYLDWNYEGTRAVWRWRYSGSEIRVVDRERGESPHRGKGTFQATITATTRSMAAPWRGIDPLDPLTDWRVTTCGQNGKGATRHRECLTAAEAVDCLLAWLDRRYKVEVA